MTGRIPAQQTGACSTFPAQPLLSQLLSTSLPVPPGAGLRERTSCAVTSQFRTVELALSNRPGDGLQQLRPPPSNPFTILCCESWLGPGKDRRGPSVSPRWLQEDLSMNGSRRGKGQVLRATTVSRLVLDPDFGVPSPCPGRALGAPGPLLSLQCGPILPRAAQSSRTGERSACGVHRSPSCSEFVALTPEGSVLGVVQPLLL